MTASSEQHSKAWAGFVYELRRHGFIDDPQVLKGYFLGYFSDYLKGNDSTSLTHYCSHCCDGLDSDNGLYKGRYWDEWTEDDRAKWHKEYQKLVKTDFRGGN